MKLAATINWAIVSISVLLLSGCVDLGNPNYPTSSYPSGSGYYGGGYDDDYYRRREYERSKDAAREARRERERLEDERERLERERERLEREQAEREAAPPPRERAPERCPSGFSPSERKCSNEERRRGCKDMRLPGGLGCVKR